MMPLPEGEPVSAEAVAAWVRRRNAEGDPFAGVRDASEAHRASHGPACTVYPTSTGRLLGVLTAAVGATRVLEVGTGLGYSALWLASGAKDDGSIDTIEADAEHARLAREHIERHGAARRITVHHGRGTDALARLEPSYDLAYLDADLEEYPASLNQFLRLLRPGGLLISSNLFLGQYTGDVPGIAHAVAYRERLLAEPRLRTAFLPGGLALSVAG